MTDAVDRVIKNHIQSLLSFGGNKIPVISVGNADQEEQGYSQLGMQGKGDRIPFPFVSVYRVSDITITDEAATKRVHNYTGYLISEADNQPQIAATKLSYYRCNLSYTATVYAETRKMSEDIATSLYGKLRNNCEVDVVVVLPIKHKDVDEHGVEVFRDIAVKMRVDIEMQPTIQQVAPLDLTKAQVYKCRVSFLAKNVNIYTPTFDRKYKFRIVMETYDTEGNKSEDAPVIFEEQTVIPAPPDKKPTRKKKTV